MGLRAVPFQGETVTRVWPLHVLTETSQLPDPHANTFPPHVLRKAMMETIAHINTMTEAENITEVGCPSYHVCIAMLNWPLPQPSLMNFCVTDGESVVATRYISSRHEEAASLVNLSKLGINNNY